MTTKQYNNRNQMEPKTFGQVVTTTLATRDVTNVPQQSLPASPALRQKTMLVLQRYGSRENFLTTFSPSLQLNAAKHEDRAFFGEAPVLGLLRQAYGESTPVMWLMPQIWDLCEFTNSRGKLSDDMIEQLAGMIAEEYGFLKVTELLLFFYRFKCGRYGRFYGNIDPMVIMIALGDFIDERDQAIRHHEKAEEERLAAQAPKSPTVKPEEWCRQIGLPECHDAISVMRMRDRIINQIEGLVWAINLFHKILCPS